MALIGEKDVFKIAKLTLLVSVIFMVCLGIASPKINFGWLL